MQSLYMFIMSLYPVLASNFFGSSGSGVGNVQRCGWTLWGHWVLDQQCKASHRSAQLLELELCLAGPHSGGAGK